MNRPLIRFATTTLIAALGITTAFAGSIGGGTTFFAGESIPVINQAIVKPEPQSQPKTKSQQNPATRSGSRGSTTPAAKPTRGSHPKPGPKPSSAINAGVVYYTNGIEVNIGQVQQAAQELQPLVEQAMRNMPSAEQIQEMARELQGPVTPQAEQAMRNMPSAEQIQEMARQLQGPVTQQVEQAVQQLPQPIQETMNEPIIITPRSVNAGNVNRNGNGSRSTRRSSDWTYGIPGMTGGNGNGPLIYNP